ncbi:TetR/AcrR family transcriptional regulator [Sphingopyxis sp.]|uniref:TetR/AcrR family transcriptional regulator n=1 Tax=Sphingopyxis sp. TaxID=1908224 RepID=UPI002D76F46D|nr:TetR/AcrR family transcriptional regulator [Sphingopyxis sp.]HET6525154.1 TetR/AcrR family transcriptional regulator [Sphingopyxis sp.]
MSGPEQDEWSQSVTRSERTKARILIAAERLFAQRGIEGTSLREISAAAGLANTSSVQYHFGGKDELLQGLFTHRMLQMEARRGAMLERAEDGGLLDDMRTLMDIICLPHIDLADRDGRYCYAEFLAQYLLRYRPPVGPIADPPELPAPVNLYRVQQLIRARLDHLPEDVIVRRLIVAVLGFLAVLINHKSFEQGAGPGLDVALSDTLEQIASAMSAPFSGNAVRSMPTSQA